MNGFDILTIIIVAFCLIRGCFRGLIGEISGIIGVVAAFYGAYTYYPMVSAVLVKWISGNNTANLLSFFFLFCAIMIVISLIALLIRKLLRLVFLGWVDRTFGLVFGAAKGILIVSVILIMLTSFLPGNPKFITRSKLAPQVARISETLSVFVSENGRSDFLKQLKEAI